MFALVTAQGYGYAPGVDAGVLCDPPNGDGDGRRKGTNTLAGLQIALQGEGKKKKKKTYHNYILFASRMCAGERTPAAYQNERAKEISFIFSSNHFGCTFSPRSKSTARLLVSCIVMFEATVAQKTFGWQGR